MGMKIRFDTANRPENPTLILATKTGKKLGLIVASGISIKDSMKDAAEITFNVNKYLNGRKNRLWNKIHKLIWIYFRKVCYHIATSTTVYTSFNSFTTSKFSTLALSAISVIEYPSCFGWLCV